MSVTCWTVAVFGVLLCWPLTSGEGCENWKQLEDFSISPKGNTYSEPADPMTYFESNGTIRLALRLRGNDVASLQDLLVVPNNTKVVKMKFVSENGSQTEEMRYESPSSGEQLWLNVSNQVVSKLILIATEDNSSAVPVSLTVVNVTACVVETATTASPVNSSANITNVPQAIYNYSSIINSTDNNSSLASDGESENGTSTPSNVNFQNATENSTWTTLQGFSNATGGYNVSLSVLGETTTVSSPSRDSDEADDQTEIVLIILGVVFGALEVLAGVVFLVSERNTLFPGRWAKRGVRAWRVQHVSPIIKA